MVSLRLKIFLASLLSALIVAAGSTYLFSNAWVDLAKAYGLINIQERLDRLSQDTRFADENEWALLMRINGDALTQGSEWIRKPQGIAEENLLAIEKAIFNNIAKSNLLSGSFELTLTINQIETPYFVVFNNRNQLGQEGQVAVAGTQAQLDLNKLTPLAAPFLGFVFVALAIAAVLAFLISSLLNRSYTTLERTLEDMGAGRFSKLNFPKSDDPTVAKISRAIQGLAQALQSKEAMIEKVSALANEDPMTKVPNFRAFNNYVDNLIPQLKAQADTKNLSSVLVIIDLDFFKKVNDTHGHQVGDFVLIEAAKAIKSNIREPNVRAPDRAADFCARYGGEEFVAVFNGVDTSKQHIGPARVLKAIKSLELTVPKEISSTGKSFQMKVSASLGIASWDNARHKDKDSWIKEADDALYEAKEGGRGRVVALHPTKQQWTADT